VEIITRAEVGYVAPKRIVANGRVEGIIAHWVGSPHILPYDDVSKVKARLRGIQNYEMFQKSPPLYDDIAYNYLFDGAGRVYAQTKSKTAHRTRTTVGSSPSAMSAVLAPRSPRQLSGRSQNCASGLRHAIRSSRMSGRIARFGRRRRHVRATRYGLSSRRLFSVLSRFKGYLCVSSPIPPAGITS
jgi:hypothetical protein